ncbi:MAG: hypothetical protein ACJ745_07625 [Actinomycetes bacterium]
MPRHHLADLTVEPADPWTAAHQAALQQRRGHPRQRAAGAGPTTSGWSSATGCWSPW